METSMDNQIDYICQLDDGQLVERWRTIYNVAPPDCLKSWLKQLLMYQVQEHRFGGLDADVLDKLRHDLRADPVVCGVDNNLARVETSGFFRKLGIPVVFIAVDYAAEQGYVFVQEPGKACFGCLFPDCLVKRKAPCRTPAVKDVLKVVAGISLYAIDSLLMECKRNWNYRNIHLAGFAPDSARNIEHDSRGPL